MNHQLLTDNTVIYYVVRVQGRDITSKVESRAIAEAELSRLPAETRALAEVVPVTADGNQLLLG